MKSRILSGAVLAAACCLTSFALISCGPEKKGDDLKFNPTKVEVAVGKTSKVVVTKGTAPYTVTSKDIKTATATSVKDTIFVTGVKAGNTSVTVTDNAKKSADLTVTVK